jgi:hypothetical protein
MIKSAGHNEPDNIRDFDNHPGSPYYEEPALVCQVCKRTFEPGYGEESESYPLLNFCSKDCSKDYEEAQAQNE